MVIEGVIIYTFLSNFAVSMATFHFAGGSMFTWSAFGLSVLFSAIMSTMFYGLTLWSRKEMIKNREFSFPFIGIAIHDINDSLKGMEMNINFKPGEYETEEIEVSEEKSQDSEE